MRKVFSQAEKNLAQQPIERDGFSSDRFDKLYGKDKDPYLGSERDRVNRKGTKRISVPSGEETEWFKCSKCGKEYGGYMDEKNKLCWVCISKQ